MAKAEGRDVRVGPARLLAVLLTAALAALPAPVLAAVKIHVTASATPTTARFRSVVVVAGTVTPSAAAGVTVQRLVGRAWHTVAHTSSAKSGRYTVSLLAPRTAVTWQLRAVRGSARSATVTVRVVTKAFTVRASSASTVVAPAAISVAGTVTPKEAGSVVLQALSHKTWMTVGSAKLQGTSYTVTATRPAGTYVFRVLRGFTATVAAGVSKAFTVTVVPAVVPPPLPVITTATLPLAALGLAYTTTLAATSGTPPYTWAMTGLPVGLTLSPTGVLSGTPVAAAVSALTATVTDGAGQTAAASLSLTVAHGAAHAWGRNNDEQLGDGTLTPAPVPVAVKTITDVIAMAGASDAGYALTADRTVWAWGFNASGQLGDNTTTAHSTPALVVGLTGVTAIAGANATGYALKADGTVWAWGNGGSGELGNNAKVSVPTPVQVVDIPDATAIAAGEGGGYALRKDGTVWAWGNNDDGALGDGGTEVDSQVPVKVSNLAGVIAIAAGGSHAYALLGDGTVMAWGHDTSGELGDNGTASRGTPGPVVGLAGVATIGSGSQTGYAVKNDGTVWSWGYGLEGELGNGGASSSGRPVQTSGPTGVVSVIGTGSDGFALTADGSAYGWGFNGDGETGTGGTATPVLTPTRVSGLDHVVLLGTGAAASSAYAVTAG